jgi:diaminohydroxyphosphoribosylaminopyrimidine deaminase/5-amino-6-(5-phosphoribosylamino)uracil reductase
MSGPSTDARWMRRALELAGRCRPVPSAYCVGAVIVARDGQEIGSGFSRETGPVAHAEEVALARAGGGHPGLAGATLYSTLEPCSERGSAPRSCTELILAAGIGRVVFAWREPPLFVADCQGAELLAAAGVTVTELAEFAPQARAVNAHLPVGD